MRPRAELVRKLTLFVATGGINTGSSWLVYVSLLYLGLGVAVSYTVSFVAGLAISALLNLRLVFKAPRSPANLARYACAYILMYLAGLGGTTLLVHLGVPPQWAPLLIVPAMVPLSFLTLRAALVLPPIKLARRPRA